jgi:pyrimidine operon attenuation protein/uracil phosphoribosyltransferase|tara:strand:- start:79360 stop:79869 length:510 start_codon:yes stop_codon:yes gene_type:complete
VNYDNDWINARLDDMAAALQQRLAEQQRDNIKLVGIHSGGAWIAEALAQRLGKPPLGTLDITFYRDDFTRRGMHPSVKPTILGFDVKDQHLILIDDVLMTGRTIRAAMNELFDYGRPASITLVTLFDVGQRELPISADICGETLALSPHQRVELSGPAPFSAAIVSTTS